MIIDELVTILGLEIAPGVLPKIQRFQGMLDSVIKTVGYVSASLVSAASGAAYFAERMNQTSANMAKMGQITGLNTDEVQKMAFAAQLAGGNIDEMTNDIARMQETMNSPIPGQYNHGLFMMLGEKGLGSKNAIEVMDRINKFLNEGNKTTQEKMQWGKSLGLTDSSLLLLTKTRSEFEKLMKVSEKTGFFIGEKDLHNALRFTTQVNVLRESIGALARRVASVAAPAMEKLTGDFTSWVSKNKEWVEIGTQYVMDGIILGFTSFGETLKFVKEQFEILSVGMKRTFPEYEKFIDLLEKTNVVSKIVYASLVALSGTLLALGLRFVALNPYIAAISVAVTLLASNWDRVSKAFNDFYDNIKGKANEIKKWIDDISGFGAEGTNYNAKGSGKGFGEIAQNLLSNTFVGRLFNKPPGGQQSTNNVTINQTINGDSAMGVSHEVKKGTLDALSQTYPGMLTPVVN